MGKLKTLERKGKRLLVRITTALVHTPPAGVDDVLAIEPRRILVIRQHNQMGDMLLATPAFRAIKETFPSAEVTVLTGGINRDVLLNSPHVDHLLTYRIRSPLAVPRLIAAMRRAHFDLAIVLHTVSFSFTSALFGLMSGARFRVGSTSAPFGNRLSESFFHLDLPLPTAEQLQGMNEAEHNLFPLAALGIRTKDISPLLVPDRGHLVWAEATIAGEDASLSGTAGGDGAVRVVVHPGAGKVQNIWPPEKFANVVNGLAARVPLRLYAIQGPRDAVPVRIFRERVDVPAVVVRDRSIGEVAALMQRSDLVLCNDTGVMHVSCAAGARTLAVFGPTDPARWAPRCANLFRVLAPRGDLTALDPQQVLERALSLLDELPRGSVERA